VYSTPQDYKVQDWKIPLIQDHTNILIQGVPILRSRKIAHLSVNIKKIFYASVMLGVMQHKKVHKLKIFCNIQGVPKKVGEQKTIFLYGTAYTFLHILILFKILNILGIHVPILKVISLEARNN
jgi:hypothetical protein